MMSTQCGVVKAANASNEDNISLTSLSAIKQTKNHISWHLVPFLLTTFLYFFLQIPNYPPSNIVIICKCGPIWSLIYLVTETGIRRKCSYDYSKKIILGLIFGCVGDAMIIWNEYFLHALVLFLVGHVSYIWAFGFQQWKIKTGLFVFMFCCTAISYLYPHLKRFDLRIGIILYAVIINIMIWRAIARVQQKWTLIQISTSIGSVLFAISDLMIAINRFVQPIPNCQVYIMATYYLAQLSIALSVVDIK